MRRKLIPRIATAKSFLPKEQQTQLSSGKAKQIFRTMIKRLTKSEPVDERKLRAIAKIAAKRATEEKSKQKVIPAWKAKLTAKLNKYSSLTSLTKKFLKKIPSQQTITFKNGVRARTKLILGKPDGPWDLGQKIGFFESFGQGVRLTITPTQITKELFDKLNAPSSKDITKGLRGSIGYVGLTINSIGLLNKPSLLIHTIQQRKTSLSQKELKEYDNWRVEAIHYAEELARKMGLKSVMIISSETIRSFYENEQHFFQNKNIGEEYERLEQKLKVMGYTHKIIIPRYNHSLKYVYLVKNL